MIDVENHTPFPCLAFEKYGRYGVRFDVITFKMTFRLKNGYYADLADRQAGLVMADEYYGEPETSSLKYETDLVLRKKNTDIHIIGSAMPAGGSASEWMAGVRVGNFSKRLCLSGPRYWRYEGQRWRLSSPEKTDTIPLRYELAYGGFWQTEGQSPHSFSANPVGCGFYPDISVLDTEQQYVAPQITRYHLPDDNDFFIETLCTPQGTGPMSRWWQNRLQFAGTYDNTWREERFPFFPDDFNEHFYNSAHPELVLPGYLTGNECIVLEGVLPDSNRVVTGLPGFKPVFVLKDHSNYPHTFFPFADTLVINLDERLIYLTWRLTLPALLNMKEGILGCIVPQQMKGVCHG
ncbi:DUF2169 family type VI secretion system accessory protein [Escherichia sp. HH26CH]|uniref:DUF2169 family type VI secretion system accessory protein n=1 Tax=Escherichia sp. HH26CH TaxID=2508713 RepID=UPI001368F199|nr:DUF2169 domain-containing protein [Escherichia sp. HH26CH]EHL1440696.1 DUF2169 domain-containing protein [Escherichia coli]MXC82539.1 DUF2169 domain-containing protein [Escherichia sp. HH26CH]HBH7998787.1 DUF2169 domain-containing protein [Escherichia coli]HBH8045348.1 DUF2169 domain-containing protein [Escherichia coli]HCJ8595560.1 DUF2169 domain-containing protein [Escherichia coli]